jgi:hypothetical protein
VIFKPTLLRTRTYGKEMAMLLAAQLVNSWRSSRVAELAIVALDQSGFATTADRERRENWLNIELLSSGRYGTNAA